MNSASIDTWQATQRRMQKEYHLIDKKLRTLVTKDEDFKKEFGDLSRNLMESNSGINKKIEHLRTMYDELRYRLLNIHSASDQQLFQQLLEAFENKLTLFKITMRSEYDTLEDSEKALVRDLNRVQNLLDEWNDSDHVGDPDASAQMSEEKIEHLNDRRRSDMERKAAIGIIDRKVITVAVWLM